MILILFLFAFLRQDHQTRHRFTSTVVLFILFCKQNYLYLKVLKSATTVVNVRSESTLSNRLQNVGTVESAV